MIVKFDEAGLSLLGYNISEVPIPNQVDRTSPVATQQVPTAVTFHDCDRVVDNIIPKLIEVHCIGTSTYFERISRARYVAWVGTLPIEITDRRDSI